MCGGGIAGLVFLEMHQIICEFHDIMKLNNVHNLKKKTIGKHIKGQNVIFLLNIIHVSFCFLPYVTSSWLGLSAGLQYLWSGLPVLKPF